MTVADLPIREVKDGNGTTGPYTFSFQTLTDPDTNLPAITCTIFRADGTTQALTQGAGTNGFTVALAAEPGTGGDITLTEVLPGGGTPDELVIEQSVPFEQPAEIPLNGRIPSTTLQRIGDRAVFLAQRLRDLTTRSLLLPANYEGPQLAIPAPVSGQFLRGNVTEDGFENADITGTGSIGIPVPINQGGTNAITAALARQNLAVPGDDDNNTLSGINTITGELNFGVGGTLAAPRGAELVISGGSITPTDVLHTVDTEAGAGTDNLDTIATTNMPNGSLLLLAPESISARVITVRDNQGNIQLQGDTDFVMNTVGAHILLRRDGAQWNEVMRTPAINTPGLNFLADIAASAGQISSNNAAFYNDKTHIHLSLVNLTVTATRGVAMRLRAGGAVQASGYPVVGSNKILSAYGPNATAITQSGDNTYIALIPDMVTTENLHGRIDIWRNSANNVIDIDIEVVLQDLDRRYTQKVHNISPGDPLDGFLFGGLNGATFGGSLAGNIRVWAE